MHTTTHDGRQRVPTDNGDGTDDDDGRRWRTTMADDDDHDDGYR
jgi:hypothetical protein